MPITAQSISKARPRRSSSSPRPPRAPVKSSSVPDRLGIATDTAIMPWIIAAKICEEAANYLNSPVPLRYKDHLETKAELCYASHRQFRKLMRSPGNEGRDALYRFMRHWLAARLHKNHPALYAKLPKTFQLGERLPTISLASFERTNHRL